MPFHFLFAEGGYQPHTLFYLLWDEMVTAVQIIL